MKKSIYLVGLSLLFLTVLGFSQSNLYPPQLAAFRDAKEAQEQRLARELHMRVPTEVNDFFKMAHQSDLLAISNMVERLGAQLSAGYPTVNFMKPTLARGFWSFLTREV